MVPGLASPSAASTSDRGSHLPRGGAVIFALQILMVAIVPIVDDGRQLAPLSYVLSLLVVQSVTVGLLGHPRTAIALSTAGSVAIASLVASGLALPARLLLWGTLIAGGAATVGLAVRTCFAARVPAVQRIFCGAAAYVMLGFVFAAIHGLAGFLIGGGYVLQPGLERARPVHWGDYVWLSFATLTTTGFGDVVGVGPVPSAISTLESVTGVLFPATLVARIASLVDADSRR